MSSRSGDSGWSEAAAPRPDPRGGGPCRLDTGGSASRTSRSISKIERFSHGLSFEEFCADDKTFDAVVRNFGIIGEAARHVSPEITNRHPEVPWSSMRGMRNFVVHVYFGTDAEIIWGTIHTDFPTVVPQLRRILEEEQS